MLEVRAWAPLPVPAIQAPLPVVVSAGRRRPGGHREAVQAADLPPQPPLPVEAAPGADEEEAAGLVSLSRPRWSRPAPAQSRSPPKGSPK